LKQEKLEFCKKTRLCAHCPKQNIVLPPADSSNVQKTPQYTEKIKYGADGPTKNAK